jgi:hypothetical protein
MPVDLLPELQASVTWERLPPSTAEVKNEWSSVSRAWSMHTGNIASTLLPTGQLGVRFRRVRSSGFNQCIIFILVTVHCKNADKVMTAILFQGCSTPNTISILLSHGPQTMDNSEHKLHLLMYSSLSRPFFIHCSYLLRALFLLFYCQSIFLQPLAFC